MSTEPNPGKLAKLQDSQKIKSHLHDEDQDLLQWISLGLQYEETHKLAAATYMKRLLALQIHQKSN